MPRLWTPPLRDLSDPDASYGYDLIDFAELIGWPLDPWQRWLAIHIGELLPDGRPRFRVVLVLIARQNGKTVFCRILTLYWMYVERVQMVVATNSSREYAKASWKKVIEMAEGIDILARRLPIRHVVKQVGEEEFFTHIWPNKGWKSTYKFAATNRRAGRSLTVDRGVLDELREHHDWETWGALTNATNAVRDAQIVAITNQGDARGVVLDSLRTTALTHIETGAGDPRLGLFEWSAPNGASVTDLSALALANPDLGNRMDPDALMGAALRAEQAGGAELTSFKTEVLCQRVTLLDPAIDPEGWKRAGLEDDELVDLALHRRRVAACLDVSLMGDHATLMAAATIDGITYVEVVKTWSGVGCTRAVRAELGSELARIKARVLVWFPGGPAAAIQASMRGRRRDDAGKAWPPAGVRVEEIGAETPAVCMGLAEQVLTLEVRHPRDPMLTDQVSGTQKLRQGEARWVYTRAGTTPVDATYATAGAVHAARSLPVLREVEVG